MKIDNVPRLVANLQDKKNVVDNKLLKFYLSHGLVLKKVHKALRYLQKEWMKPYIDRNTKLRQKAKIKMRHDVPKLINNASYGKTCENKESWVGMQMCTSEKKFA